MSRKRKLSKRDLGKIRASVRDGRLRPEAQLAFDRANLERRKERRRRDFESDGVSAVVNTVEPYRRGYS